MLNAFMFGEIDDPMTTAKVYWSPAPIESRLHRSGFREFVRV